VEESHKMVYGRGGRGMEDSVVVVMVKEEDLEQSLKDPEARARRTQAK